MMALAKISYILVIKVMKLFSFISSWCFLKQIEKVFSLFLLSFSINLLAFYNECRSLIGYVTHYLYHVIKNTANQNTGMSLYIQRYYISKLVRTL